MPDPARSAPPEQHPGSDILDILLENHYPSPVPTAERRHELRRTHAATGAPTLLVGWVTALLVGSRLLAGVTARPDWLPSATALTVWWWVMAAAAAGHLGSWLGMRRASSNARAEADAGGDDDDDVAGRPLRMGAGALALATGVALLYLVAGVVFSGRTAPEVHAVIDRALSGFVGVGVACVLLAASALYFSEELPRAAHTLGLARSERGRRASQVIALVIACILFGASMNIVSHFSVGAALFGGAP